MKPTSDKIIWDEATFYRVVGRPPIQDDLERVNCERAGTPGHRDCGLCIHYLPRFLCPGCVHLAVGEFLQDFEEQKKDVIDNTPPMNLGTYPHLTGAILAGSVLLTLCFLCFFL